LVFSERDVKQIESIGKTLEAAEGEIRTYAAGIPAVKLQRPCSLDDGIIALSPAQQLEFAGCFEEAMASGRAMKFVAASGAASRMFSAPLICLERGWTAQKRLIEKAYEGNGAAKDCLELFRNLPKFAFFPKLKALMISKQLNLEELVEGGSYKAVLETLLQTRGLGYAYLPKGFIPFHSYPDGTRTAFEEHLVESAGYLKNRDGVAKVHFTVSPEHLSKAEAHLRQASTRLGSLDAHYEVTLSTQERWTDSIAASDDNQPLRDKDGGLIFRPSGHGALLQNLNLCQGDLVFVRTIDNVLPDRLKGIVQFHQRVLGGYLVALQEELFGRLKFLASHGIDESSIDEIEKFARSRMNLLLPNGFSRMAAQEKSQLLFRLLNVPLRVCGMVRNSLYPGGRPFWIRDEDGIEHPQIVEAAQVDGKDADQNLIWKSCEFFNPADIVCGVRDYEGHPFDLTRFSNPALGFITQKNHEGRLCRVLERPGLWNGAMAYWSTVFVEVPALTLHPIKSILDLLSEQNQP
jgi:hypothetical protein